MKKFYNCLFIALVIACNGGYAYSSDCMGEGCGLSKANVIANAVVQDTVVVSGNTVSSNSCGVYNSCPFKTKYECNIWRKKPMVNEVVSPRSPKISSIDIHDFILAVSDNKNITGNDSVSAPLLERYNMLMRASSACCQSGIIYKMREQNASDEKVYEFLVNDVTAIGVSDSCLVYDDEYLYQNKSEIDIDIDSVIDVRNTCLCKNSQWFSYLLKPFEDIYKELPEFKSADFSYYYIDGLGRTTVVSINKEVQNVLSQLDKCL